MFPVWEGSQKTNLHPVVFALAFRLELFIPLNGGSEDRRFLREHYINLCQETGTTWKTSGSFIVLNPRETDMARPEKMFNIIVTIYKVPQSKINDWLNDFAAMENDSTVEITEIEVEIPIEEDKK